MKKFFSVICVSLLTGCGGGSEVGGGVGTPLLEGEFSICDNNGERDFRSFTPQTDGSFGAKAGTKYYATKDCSGNEVAREYTVLPINLSINSSLGSQTVYRNGSQYSADVYQVTVNTPENSIVLSGTGVYVNSQGKQCVDKGVIGHVCFDSKYPIGVDAKVIDSYLGIGKNITDPSSGITYATTYFELTKSGAVYSIDYGLPKN